MGRVICVMGVSGSGKSTLGQALAQRLDAQFLEGDAFHPDSNVEWMRAGNPLTDDMRWPWLTALGEAAKAEADKGGNVVFACSALKKIYRDHLRGIIGEMRFVCLAGAGEEILTRMRQRKNHYMPPSLLTSQLATLELPDQGDERDTLIIPIDKTKGAQLVDALSFLKA